MKPCCEMSPVCLLESFEYVKRYVRLRFSTLVSRIQIVPLTHRSFEHVHKLDQKSRLPQLKPSWHHGQLLYGTDAGTFNNGSLHYVQLRPLTAMWPHLKPEWTTHQYTCFFIGIWFLLAYCFWYTLCQSNSLVVLYMKIYLFNQSMDLQTLENSYLKT